jgi:hypothetical protein
MAIYAPEHQSIRPRPPRCYTRAHSLTVDPAGAPGGAVLVTLAMFAVVTMFVFAYLAGGGVR